MEKLQRFKQWLKKNRKSENCFLRISIRIFDLCVHFIRTVKGLLIDKNARSIFCMKAFHSKRTHQTTATTCLNRYPQIFSACKKYFGDREKIRILSFGCSTGEEVITLQNYFPNAVIIGAEINKNSLAICRKLDLGESVHFIDSSPQKIDEFAPYDAIFCMAVFQRTPGMIADKKITDIKRIYPFEKFENQVVELDKYLNKSGLLIIHMSQYDFSDTVLAPNYEAYGDYNQNYYGSFVFDRDSKIKKKRENRNSIFIKNK